MPDFKKSHNLIEGKHQLSISTKESFYHNQILFNVSPLTNVDIYLS